MTAAPDTAWMNSAACATAAHRGLPWLDDSHAVPAVLVDVMGAICADCPVLAACARYVSRAGVTGGFWAGADRGLSRPHPPVVQLDLNDLLERDDLLEHGDRRGGAA